MATLIVNGADLPRLSRRIVERLQRQTLGYEALMGWTGSSHQSVAKELHKLKAKGLVEHDGRRPRTWGIAGTEFPTEAPKPKPCGERHPWADRPKPTSTQPARAIVPIPLSENNMNGLERWLSWQQLRPYIGGMGRSTIWRLIKRGDFPKPMQVCAGRVAWREGDIRKWQASLCEAKEPEAA